MIPTRKCPFTGCGKVIHASKFACQRHWFSIPAAGKAEIYHAYSDYVAGRISFEELRERQQAVIGEKGKA